MKPVNTEETLSTYVRQRAKALGLSMKALGEQAGVGRQTLYDLALIPHKLPTLQTVIALARVLRVHPLRLFHFVFDAMPLSAPAIKARHRSDCSAFLRDVTYPDGELVMPGQQLTKTWEIQNVGKVPWENRFLRCTDEDILVYVRTGEQLRIASGLEPGSRRVPIPETMPGDVACISVDFKAPLTPGTVVSYWVSEFADGTRCFPEGTGLWVKVQVVSPTRASIAEVASG